MVFACARLFKVAGCQFTLAVTHFVQDHCQLLGYTSLCDPTDVLIIVDYIVATPVVTHQ